MAMDDNKVKKNEKKYETYDQEVIKNAVKLTSKKPVDKEHENKKREQIVR